MVHEPLDGVLIAEHGEMDIEMDIEIDVLMGAGHGALHPPNFNMMIAGQGPCGPISSDADHDSSACNRDPSSHADHDSSADQNSSANGDPISSVFHHDSSDGDPSDTNSDTFTYHPSGDRDPSEAIAVFDGDHDFRVATHLETEAYFFAISSLYLFLSTIVTVHLG